MINTVVDTNMFISGIHWHKGNPRFVLRLFQNKEIAVIFSEPLLSELVKKLVSIDKRYGFNPAVGHGWIYLLKTRARFVASLPKIEICRDSKDNMVLATAVAGEAEYIITGDKDLLSLKKYKKIKVVTAKDFLTEAAK